MAQVKVFYEPGLLIFGVKLFQVVSSYATFLKLTQSSPHPSPLPEERGLG